MTSPCAKLPIACAALAAAALRGLDPIREARLDRHVPVARQIEEARRQIGIAGAERGLDLALGHRGVE